MARRLHYGFLLDEVETARRLLRRLEGSGLPIENAYEEPGFVVFKVRDPDGYLVEVEAGVPVAPPA